MGSFLCELNVWMHPESHQVGLSFPAESPAEGFGQEAKTLRESEHT